ncbi:MAG: YigZ family protein [Clostridia bacterium]|nr:YigZ family protein [Clostridia bacterium]
MMVESYRTVSREAKDEFTEKKSVFIGHIKPIETEEQALEFIKALDKKYSDAAHNCYAYINKEQNVVRFSDNGEPQGTAGMPILEVIKREGLCGVVIVVTRYFGGILLGAGGLVRAYSKAAKIAIDAAGVTTFCPFSKFKVKIDYTLYNKLLHDFEKYHVRCLDSSFDSDITLTLTTRGDRFEAYRDYLRELTGGKLDASDVVTVYDDIEL